MRQEMHLVIVIVILIPLSAWACGPAFAGGVPVAETPEDEVWDVLVVGADPEGVAAAVYAARLGLETALVDHRERVGGLYTAGALNMLDLNYKYPGRPELIHTGFFAEFHRAMGGHAAFDIGRAERWFEAVLDEAGVRVFLGFDIVAPLMDGSRIVGITADDGEVVREFRARRVIDATQDADVAAAAGAPYRTGRAEFGTPDVYAAATLVFALEGVDWLWVRRYLWGDGNPDTGSSERAAWGYMHMFRYGAADPHLQLRGLNLGLQDDGTVVVNALQIFGVDPLDPESRREGMERALAELPSIVHFMRWNCPGFIGASLAWTADELYIRESRRIVGERTLTGEDVFESRFPADTIALGSYPVDLQPVRRGDQGMALNGTKPYGIPFGVLVPQRVDDLLVVGKAASYDIIAHGSARTVPVGMATAAAAAAAAYYSLETGKSFREMSDDRRAVEAVRALLAEQGVDLTPVETDYPEREHWSYPHIQWLRGRALLSKGYANDYRLDEPASIPGVARTVLERAGHHFGLEIDVERVADYPEHSTVADWERLAAEVLRAEYRTVEELHRDGVLDYEARLHLAHAGDTLTHGQAYALLAAILQARLGI